MGKVRNIEANSSNTMAFENIENCGKNNKDGTYLSEAGENNRCEESENVKKS